jgi:two-component system, sporulation sensor kinase E
MPRDAQNRRAEELVLENEARMQLALDGAYVGLFEWDIQTHQSQWSAGFYLLHGIDPSTSPSYEVWRQQVHPDDIHRVEGDVRRAVETLTAVDTDYRIRRADGELRWTLLQANVHSDEHGKPTTMRGFCGDITRRKLAEAALLESERLAITGRLSSAIAHEINNPLEAAFNLLYLARGQATAAPQMGLLDEALDQLQRVSVISTQTLRFSRRTKPAVVKASAVLQSTLSLLAPKLKLSGIAVRTDFRGDPELMIAPGELQQMLVNIINNAADAMQPGGTLCIRVRSARSLKDRNTSGVRVLVADCGSGMSRETLRRIREPFFTTKEAEGTGLGMWVVHELLTKSAGTLSIRTSTQGPRQGSSFSLFLPTGIPNQG